MDSTGYCFLKKKMTDSRHVMTDTSHMTFLNHS